MGKALSKILHTFRPEYQLKVIRRLLAMIVDVTSREKYDFSKIGEINRIYINNEDRRLNSLAEQSARDGAALFRLTPYLSRSFPR